MQRLILPDTSVYLDAMRAGVDPFRAFSLHLDTCEFATCGLVVLEVCRGLREPRVLEAFIHQFSVMIYLPTSNTVWERAQQNAWTLDGQGIVLSARDHFLAACALQCGATLLTRERQFQQIPGLIVAAELD